MTKKSLKQRKREEAQREDRLNEDFSSKRRKQADVRKKAAEFEARRNQREWKVTKLPDGQAGLECPRCGNKTVVNGKKWVMFDTDFLTRGCTYCYAPIFIPKKFLPPGDPRR